MGDNPGFSPEYSSGYSNDLRSNCRIQNGLPVRTHQMTQPQPTTEQLQQMQRAQQMRHAQRVRQAQQAQQMAAYQQGQIQAQMRAESRVQQQAQGQNQRLMQQRQQHQYLADGYGVPIQADSQPQNCQHPQPPQRSRFVAQSRAQQIYQQGHRPQQATVNGVGQSPQASAQGQQLAAIQQPQASRSAHLDELGARMQDLTHAQQRPDQQYNSCVPGQSSSLYTQMPQTASTQRARAYRSSVEGQGYMINAQPQSPRGHQSHQASFSSGGQPHTQTSETRQLPQGVTPEQMRQMLIRHQQRGQAQQTDVPPQIRASSFHPPSMQSSSNSPSTHHAGNSIRRPHTLQPQQSTQQSPLEQPSVQAMLLRQYQDQLAQARHPSQSRDPLSSPNFISGTAQKRRVEEVLEETSPSSDGSSIKRSRQKAVTKSPVPHYPRPQSAYQQDTKHSSPSPQASRRSEWSPNALFVDNAPTNNGGHQEADNDPYPDSIVPSIEVDEDSSSWLGLNDSLFDSHSSLDEPHDHLDDHAGAALLPPPPTTMFPPPRPQAQYQSPPRPADTTRMAPPPPPTPRSPHRKLPTYASPAIRDLIQARRMRNMSPDSYIHFLNSTSRNIDEYYVATGRPFSPESTMPEKSDEEKAEDRELFAACDAFVEGLKAETSEGMGKGWVESEAGFGGGDMDGEEEGRMCMKCGKGMFGGCPGH